MADPPAGEVPPGSAPQPVIARVGEIRVTAAAVRTPDGELPLRGTTWHVAADWRAERRIPGWAIGLAVLGFFVSGPFSLLLLRVRRTRHRGVARVTVTAGPRRHVAEIPVADQRQLRYLAHQVDYVRALAEL